jgi:hypothetical protein
MPQRIHGDRVLLSTSEAVQASGLSREHIQRLARQKRIEGIKPAHDWFVFEDSLQAFLAQPRKTGPKPKASREQSKGDALSTASTNIHKNNGRDEC